MAEALGDLISLLDLEDIERNLFRGRSPEDYFSRVFGGQVLGQALVAASRTIEGARACHSLHAYFLRPGDPKIPILYEVVRSRDGRSFSSRRVIAIQKGEEIFHMSASFQEEQTGLDHAVAMPPNVPEPGAVREEMTRRKEILAKVPKEIATHFIHERPIELRPVNPVDFFDPRPSLDPQYVWFRAVKPLPGDPHIHLCVLAYASDMTLLDTSLTPHGLSWFSGKVKMASIDHAMWFHRPFRADRWLLYVQDSPSASAARGFNRGLIYAQDGTLVASVAQEGLMRVAGV